MVSSRQNEVSLLEYAANYVGFEAGDLIVLREASRFVEPRLDELADLFYENLLARPQVQMLFEDAAQVDRLKKTLRKWASEFFTEKRDGKYLESRLRIGKIHHRVGVTDLYIVGAMGIVRRFLIEVVETDVPLPLRSATRMAIEKGADLDLILMAESYQRTAHDADMEEGYQRLRSVLEQAPVAVFLYDREFRITEWNPAAEKLFGFSRTDVITDGPFETFVSPEDSDYMEKIVSRVFSGEETGAINRTHRTKDGGRISTIVAHAPIRRDGRIREAVAFCLDVTELTALREKLVEQEKMAALGTLAAGLAHEVGNPLASISAICQIIQKKSTDTKLNDRIKTVHEAIGRIDSIVRSVLTFARPSEENQRISISEAVKQALELVLMDRRMKGIAVNTSIPTDLPFVNAPRAGIIQVIINILFNASDSLSGVSSPAIEIDVKEVKDGVTMTVRDNGSGLSKETIHRAKEPFFSTKDHGTGLGLAISYGIVERARGRITLSNHVDGGAVVTVWLPTGGGLARAHGDGE